MAAPRTILVTGGVSGIGRAIAEAFAAENNTAVHVTARTTAEIAAAPPCTAHITAHALDITDAPAIPALFTRLQLSRLDCLVNAAGTIRRDNQEFSPENFAHVVDVNLNGTMRVCLAAKEFLVAARGTVINIASMLCFFGSGYAPAYSASKGGIAQLTKSLAIAWARHGVRVNAIAPGWIKTALTAPLHTNPDSSAAIIARTPLARWGEPADIAPAALFLASPAAAFITGVILPVDGGYSIT